MDFFCFIQLLFLTFAENTLVDDYEKKVEKINYDTNKTRYYFDLYREKRK